MNKQIFTWVGALLVLMLVFGSVAAAAPPAEKHIPKPRLLYPKNGATIGPCETHFNWTGVRNAREYVVRIEYTDGSNWIPVYNEVTPDTYRDVAGTTFSTGYSYRWSVVARGDAGYLSSSSRYSMLTVSSITC